jgi:single-stranded-DNA-specific exonuclease
VGGAKRWLLATPRPESERRLLSELGVSPLLARLLVNRGVEDPGRAGEFLAARLSENLRSPMLFRDMPRAAERVLVALRRGERIGIYGDYDVDGISGSAVLVRFLRALGSDPLLYVPQRLRDGYGVNERGVRELVEGGAKLVVTVDCGGVAHREIRVANELGADVIVCDHHQVATEPLPACAVLNPIEADAGFPFRGLCGAGVAFYLALGVRMRLRETGANPLPDLRRSLDLVALGTIADLVPIVEENRVLVKYGLRELAASQLPGVVALRNVSGVNEMSSGAVGFRLAPRLNAGGRLADAARAVELLTTEDVARAGFLAASLDDENRARQLIEREMSDEAMARVEEEGGVSRRRSLVLASSDWHPGVVGIVAARLVERFYRPTILIAIDAERGTGRGSARSIRGLNLYECLRECSEVLLGFGGHRAAAGLTIRADRVAELATRFEAEVARRTQPEDFVPVLNVDGELPLRALDSTCFADLQRLEPFGPSNSEPVFVACGLKVRNRRVVGETHLKLAVEQEGRVLPAIGFGMADCRVEVGDSIDLAFSPMLSEWGGQTTAELRVRDLHPTARE